MAAELSADLGGAPKIIALVLDLLVTGAFVGFGILAGKKLLWAYLLGMVVFLLDGLVSLFVQDLLGAVVHAVVLFLMFRSFQAGRELVSLEQTTAQQGSEPSGNRRRVTIDYGSYWQYGLPHAVREYAADGSTLIRQTFTDYNLSQAYLDRRIIGLVSQVQLTNGSGQHQSKTTYTYDDPARLQGSAGGGHASRSCLQCFFHAARKRNRSLALGRD